MKKISIAIDVDDCACNTLEMDLACAFYKYFKMGKKPENIDRTFFNVAKSFEMEDKDDFYFKEKQYIMANNSMYPKIFVKEAVSHLRKCGVKIIFASSRFGKFWNGEPEKYLKAWLDKFEIEYDEVKCDLEDKFEFLKQNKIDMIIEDRFKYVEEANKIGIKSILLKNSYNKEYSHKNNKFADSWLEVYDLVKKEFKLKGDEIIKL